MATHPIRGKDKNLVGVMAMGSVILAFSIIGSSGTSTGNFRPLILPLAINNASTQSWLNIG